MRNKQKDYYTTREAAKLLGVAVSTVQIWTNNGSLKAWTTAGGHRRIPCSAVEEMLSQKKKLEADLNSFQQISVVIVEDNTQQLRMYKKQIHAMDMNVNIEVANDGYKGMIKIARTFPDIIIADLVMPNMNGFELIKSLDELPELEHSVLIAVSGLSEEEIKMQGGLPERVHQFIKPVPFDEIETLFRQKLESKVA